MWEGPGEEHAGMLHSPTLFVRDFISLIPSKALHDQVMLIFMYISDLYIFLMSFEYICTYNNYTYRK